MVVLNTCCIRENADQRLYGTLGRLKELVDAKPGLQIAVGGCLAQKDRERIQEKVGWVDVVFGTHNLTSAPGLLRRAANEGPVMEILDAPAPESRHNPLLGSGAVRELPYAAWVNIQTGCDNSCAFCIVPRCVAPRPAAPSTTSWRRWSCWPAAGSRRSRCSGRTSTPTAATSRSAAPSSPSCCAGSARWRASGASASPARTPRICARRRSRPWQRRPRSASSCTCPSNRGATGCCAPCGAATPRRATSSGLPRRVPPSTTWP